MDGFDVTGRPATPEGQMSCRLDLPNEEQILAALRGLAILRRRNANEELVQAAAFQNLLRTGQHFTIEDIATLTKLDYSTVIGCFDSIRQAGHIRFDADGFIEGAAGLSLSPTRHEVLIDGRRFWTWCALDVIGIFGALNASGFAKSSDPSSGESIELQFIDGVVQEMNFTVFLSDLSNGASICCDWCPNTNFFVSRSSVERWAKANAAKGSVIAVASLVPVAREAWSRLVETSK